MQDQRRQALARHSSARYVGRAPERVARAAALHRGLGPLSRPEVGRTHLDVPDERPVL